MPKGSGKVTYKLATPMQRMEITYYEGGNKLVTFESGVECRLPLKIPGCEEQRLLRKN